jgi:hypothetical protein
MEESVFFQHSWNSLLSILLHVGADTAAGMNYSSLVLNAIHAGQKTSKIIMLAINNATSIIKKTNGVRCKLYFKIILVRFNPKLFTHFVGVCISLLRGPF